MDLRRLPALGPSAAFLAAVAVAPHLTVLSIPWLLALAAIAAAARRTGFALLACGALGTAWAAATWVLPLRTPLPFDRDIPVQVWGRIAGPWSERDQGGSAALSVRRLRQGAAIWVGERAMRLDLGEAVRDRPELGREVSARGYLVRSAGYENLAITPPGKWHLRVKSGYFLGSFDGPGPLDRLSHALRSRVEVAWRAAGRTSPGLALARALVLGDESAVTPEVKRGLKRAGLYHVLSVSGVHVALVAGCAWLLGSLLPRAVRWVPAALAIALYLLLVGPLPALLRASVMGVLALAAWGAGRPAVPANALAVTTLALVASEPGLVGDLGFQLSVSATAGLVLLAPELENRWSSTLPSWLRRGLSATVGAQLASLPWLLPVFPIVSPLSPALNLLIVPWTGVALGASLGWTALALVVPGWAGATSVLLDWVAAPFAWPVWPSPAELITLALPMSWLAAAGLAAALAWAVMAPPRKLALAVGVVAALGIDCGGRPALARGTDTAGDEELEFTALDVGQGDALLLRDGRQAALVDGGGTRGRDLGASVIVPTLARLGLHRLRAAVLTHPDADHCAGLLETATYLSIDELWLAPGFPDEGCVRELRARRGPRVRWLATGDRRQVGRWRLTVLGPVGAARGSDNDGSLVLRAEAGGRAVLLTGDIEEPSERRLQRDAATTLASGILKVAHHGSRTSTSEAFLDRVRPRLAIVSAGVRNSFGHPSPLVIERLRRRRVWVLRTDQLGMLALRWRPGSPLRVDERFAPRE